MMYDTSSVTSRGVGVWGNGITIHGSLNTPAKIPIVIKKTNLRLGSSGNDERIKKRRKSLFH